MKKSILAVAVAVAMGSNMVMAASPNVQGGSSGPLVDPYASNHTPFGNGDSGLDLNGLGVAIDLALGPINGSNTAIDDTPGGNGTIMTSGHAGLSPPGAPTIDIAQVWRAEASTNGANSNEYANFAINTIRQINIAPSAPQFGGLVIGQVGENSIGAPADPVTPLAVESGVYFGEWAPRATGTPPMDSTNLNMTSGDRTVWYVGDNAVSTMPTLVDATYGVIGISQTGTDASGNTLPGGLPDNPNLGGRKN